jgi:hypothetical protein
MRDDFASSMRCVYLVAFEPRREPVFWCKALCLFVQAAPPPVHIH